MARPSIYYTPEEVDSIIRWHLAGEKQDYIALQLERSPKQISKKIKSLRRTGRLTCTSQIAAVWSEFDIETLKACVQAGEKNEDIAKRLGRTAWAVRTRITLLQLSRREPPREPVNPLTPFSMPDHMRYQDDPAAIGPSRLVYMPVRNTHFQSGGSSLEGGRWLSTSGRQGAVT